MKHLRHILLFGMLSVLFSCQDDAAQHAAEIKEITKKNNNAFKDISAKWAFNIPQPTPAAAGQMANWQEWKLYTKELAQKPAAGLDAYRKKAKAMVTRTEGLLNNIPPLYDNPAVRTRISVLITKVRLISTFIDADNNIPADRIIALITDINRESALLLLQFDELVRRSQIRTEQGEEEMIRALDTVRMANPDVMAQPATGTPPRRQPAQPSYQTGRQTP
ncbi:hypothetical protein AM493_14885 [Flavobacterium akiainvivens]|uniref:DUF4142 domain-containing protein n=2 Tax=Flavobacterium akiainvivens TaxID=1202724 RepID=A0A0M8MAS0_9FLAO|nr:hypothetical protein AM493_14885 [Flavobacterium akiainvivens]